MAVNSTVGVANVLRQSGRVAVIEDALIQNIQLAEQRTKGENVTRLNVGDVVQVSTDCAFGGCVGHIERYSARDRVVLLLSVLERSVEVEIDESLLHIVDG